MNRVQRKIREVNIIWWLLLASILACCGLKTLHDEIFRQFQYGALALFAERIGIEPTFKALDVYVEETFVPGMSRSEVLKELDKLGTYELSKYSEGKGKWSEQVIFRTGTPEGVYPRVVFTFIYTRDGTLHGGTLLRASRQKP
jgi:hypothetical protein